MSQALFQAQISCVRLERVEFRWRIACCPGHDRALVCEQLLLLQVHHMLEGLGCCAQVLHPAWQQAWDHLHTSRHRHTRQQ